MFSFLKKKKKAIVEEEKVVEPADYTNVEPIAEYFKNETGVTFDNQISILTNKVMTFCRQREISSFSKLLKMVDEDALIKQELIDYLTTNETFFYREFRQITELVELVKSYGRDVEIL